MQVHLRHSIEIREVLHMNSYYKWIPGYCLILLLTLLAAHFGSRAVTVMAESRPPERRCTIIIDPGHGGVDGGATSCTGILESRFNLEIGLRLNDLFRFLGFSTKMIRTEDISVYTEGDTIAAKKMSDLRQRVQMTNEAENPLLLSIHQNNFPDGRYSGAQVFYAGTEGSQSLAKALQSGFLKHLNPGSRRQEKKSSSVYLMEHIRCPGVLIECGFLSNPEEEAKLRSPEYQKKLCTVIACTVSETMANA